MESASQYDVRYIPRREEAAIREQVSLVRGDGKSRAVLLYGAGGIGKTRLVRALASERGSAHDSAIWVQPIDVDDSEYWLISNLERVVAQKLDPDLNYFGHYFDYISRLSNYASERVGNETVVSRFGRAEQEFTKCYQSFMAETKNTVVITLDTVEAIRSRYLLLNLTQWMKALPRTLFILSGRPLAGREHHDPILSQLDDPRQRLECTKIILKGFDRQEARCFLDSSALRLSLTESEKESLVDLTEGHPLWLVLSVDFLEHSDPPPEMVEPTAEGTRLHEAFRRRLIAPYRSTEFWPEAIKRLAIVRHSVNQEVWQRLMGDRERPQGIDNWDQAWELLKQQPWVRPRANQRYVTLHDALAEELAQRLIPLHDQDETWRHLLWRKAADIYTGLTADRDRLWQELEQLNKDRWSSGQQNDPKLIRRAAKLDAEKRELDQLKTAQLHYQLLVNFQAGSDSFLELYREASERHDLLFQKLICHEMERFLPHGETAEPLEDVLGAVVERFHRWLMAEEPIRYLEIALSIAHFLTQNEQPRSALELLCDLPDSSAGPGLRYKLANERGNACMRIPGQIDGANEYFQLALEETRKFDSPERERREAEACKEFGFYYRNLGRWDEADEKYRKARDVITRILRPGCSDDDREEMASIQTNWAYLKALRGSYKEARDLVESAIAVRGRLGRRHGVGVSLSVLGEVYRYDSQFVRAWQTYGQAEEVFQALQDWPWLGVIYQEQAICLHQAVRDGIPVIDNPRDRARALIRQALDICRDLAIRFYPSALNRAGRIFGSDDADLGLLYLEESIDEARRLADGWFLSANLIEYLELSYRAWENTKKQGYRDRIDGRRDDVEEAIRKYGDFTDLRGRRELLQGHLDVHDALDSGRFDELNDSVKHYSSGLSALADKRVGSHGLSAIAREFRRFHKLGSTALHVDGGGVVWELQVDGSAGEHDGGQRGFGTVEAVGAADDQTYLVVQSFLAAV
jgi:tetratricopeptide (TPR) repeat protein